MKNTDKIIYYLKQPNDWVKASELASYLAVSKRQIRKHIATINNDEPIIISSVQGYKIDMKNYDHFIANKAFKLTSDQDNRRNYIIQKLLTHLNGYDLFDFSDELFVSETTIKKDIQAIRLIIEKYKLSIIRKQNMVKLEGNEEAIRKFMYPFIAKYSFDIHFFQEGFHLFDMSYNYYEIQTKLKKIINQFDYAYNDFTLNNLTLHLIIILNRVETGNELTQQLENKDVVLLNSYKMALLINDYFKEEYGVSFNQAELINISLIIENNINHIGNLNYDNLNLHNIYHYVDKKYIEITREIIYKVEENYYLSPFKESFITKFILHIQNLFFRNRNNFNVKNPLASTIKMAYPLVYDIAVFIAQQLKQNYEIDLNEDEIAFISFHIGSYFETNSYTWLAKVNCAFVYIEYYDFYKTTLHNLKQRFNDKINITSISTVNNYIDKIDPKIDLLILATGVHSQLKTKSVYIKPFPKEEDYLKLETVINEILNDKQRHELKGYILNFFDEKLFYHNPAFTTKKDLLFQMTKDLNNLGYTKADFYEDVINREELSATAFHDIAVPHSLTGKNTNKSFISIALFPKGIKWSKNKEVHIVAMIGIHDNSRKIFSNFFDQLICLLDDPINIQLLLTAKNFEDFFNLINKLFSKSK